MDGEEFIIEDIESLARILRREAFDCFGVEDVPDQSPTVAQVVGFVVERCPEVDGERIISKDMFFQIADTVRESLVGAALSEMAAEGSVECAWDDKTNEMVFWAAKKD